VTVDDCGDSVPGVWDVGDVVAESALVDVVEDELEQAANAKAQIGSSKRLLDHFRQSVGMPQRRGAAQMGVRKKRCAARCAVLGQVRLGAVPITEARSIDRRWGQ
jgi:hypothetical protein